MAFKKTNPTPDTGETDAQSAAEERGHTAAKSAAPKSKGITPLGKITVKTVCGTPEVSKLPGLELPDASPNPDCEVKLMRVAGYCKGVKSGQSTYGEWQALTGEFAATNYATGELYQSKTCLLPGPLGEALIDTTVEALSESADAQIRFSVDVFVKRSAREPKAKYEYVVRPVLETDFTSPALELLTMSPGGAS